MARATTKTHPLQPLSPARRSSESGEVSPLGVIADALNYVPARARGGSRTPGMVASAEEVEEASAISSWTEMALSPHCPNIQAFFPPEVKDLIPPNHVDYFSKIVHETISQQVIIDCFGGGEGSSTSLSLLLGKVSHSRKTSPMLQLEEILEIFRHVSPRPR